MKLFAIFFLFCNFFLIFATDLDLKQKQEKKNYPDVHVHMDPPTFDLKDLLTKNHDKRAKRNMIKDLEEKINLDKQAFQQITSIQNDEIQQLSEAVKLNNYYTMRKIMNTKENLEKKTKKKQENEMSLEKKLELISDPFNVVKDEQMENTLEKVPKNRLETYGDIVDKIYGA